MHQLSNWDVIQSVDALLPATLGPLQSVFKVTHLDIKLIEVEGKIHPQENLISLDFSELFVLHPDC